MRLEVVARARAPRRATILQNSGTITMRYPFATLLLLACGTALAQSERPERAAAARIALVDRVVAVVNKEVITQYELAERMNRVLKELQRRGTSLPERREVEHQVLERLVVEKVQLQFARDTGLRVDDLELDRTVNRVAEGNKLSLTEYSIAHILVRVPEQASPEQLEARRARAEEALKRLKDGADFAQLAAAYSDAPDALQGGVMGWRSQERLPELFAEALAKLKAGDVSKVLRSPAGFHVLKLVELRGAGAPLLVEQAHVRHILVRTNELVSEDDARRKLSNLRERIVNGVNFAELARLNSDDSSASRGGDLGWVYPGDMVPEFERAFMDMKPMEVSQPVKTPFGWHLIQVLERRTADMSSERRRIEARKALLDRKGDEAYQEWLRQLRDRAYVELRLEDR